MDHRLIEGLMEAIAPLIKSYVDDRIAKDIAPLRLQVSEYKSMMPERGEPGLPGKDVDWKEVEQLVLGITDQKFAIREAVHDETVRPIVEEVVAAHVAKIAPGEPGKDGKDADPEMILRLVEETVAKVPPAAAGKDASLEDIKAAVLNVVADVLPDEVAAAVEKIEKPKDGENGKDADPEVVAKLLADMIPAPKDGEPGKSVEIVDFIPVIEAEIANAMAAMEPPKDGVPGADGKSVTVEELAPLVDDVVAKKLPNLFMINEDGMLVTAYANGEAKSIGKVRGEPGVRGASVMDGNVDEDGTLILRMSDGRMLQTGVVRGHDGRDGKDGDKGAPGRDAHEIQILPGIDESKTYIDGIVAYWRGGLIRSVRQTDPIVDGDILSAGWKVYLRGIAEEHEEQVEDGRFIEKTTVYTDGTEFKRRHKTATPLYQGVWREASYLKGDVVTWAGSSFIAQRDTSDKPETTDAWKLSTKRGRDGKDGKNDRPPPVVKLDPGKR